MRRPDKLGFHDREEAGRQLGVALQRYEGRAIVLALPRGGVPVGYEIARELHVPLDVFPVRKLGVPHHPELAMGAVALGGEYVFNDEVIRHQQVSGPDITRVIAKEKEELERRNREYRQGRPFPRVRERTVILTDDGLATGATMRAAIAAVRGKGAGHIVVAVPVGADDTCHIIEREADELVTLVRPRTFHGVGEWYRRFNQLEDREVHAYLELAQAEEEKRATGS